MYRPKRRQTRCVAAIRGEPVSAVLAERNARLMLITIATFHVYSQPVKVHRS